MTKTMTTPLTTTTTKTIMYSGMVERDGHKMDATFPTMERLQTWINFFVRDNFIFIKAEKVEVETITLSDAL